MTTARIYSLVMIMIASLTAGVSAKSLAERQSDYIAGQVDTMPAFPGGEDDMMLFIVDNLSLDFFGPGRMVSDVMVECTVGRDGSIRQVEILNADSPEIARELRRVIESLPRFYPATIEGEAVACRYEIPMTIMCSDD